MYNNLVRMHAHMHERLLTKVLPQQGIGSPRDYSDKPYLIPIFSPATMMIVIRLFLLMTERTVLGK